MCGLVGLVGYPPPELIALACAGAARRGPHSHGWATYVGEWTVQHGAGPITPAVVPGLITIGHSRLATSGATPGTVPDADEGQPLVLDGTVLAHNGRVTNADLLATFPAAIDSGSLLAALHAGTALDELLADLSDGPHALLYGSDSGYLTAGRTAGRNGRPAHPLYRVDDRTWTVISSAPLPGGHLLHEGVHVLPPR